VSGGYTGVAQDGCIRQGGTERIWRPGFPEGLLGFPAPPDMLGVNQTHNPILPTRTTTTVINQ
jgi:hypothetical protein